MKESIKKALDPSKAKVIQFPAEPAKSQKPLKRRGEKIFQKLVKAMSEIHYK